MLPCLVDSAIAEEAGNARFCAAFLVLCKQRPPLIPHQVRMMALKPENVTVSDLST